MFFEAFPIIYIFSVLSCTPELTLSRPLLFAVPAMSTQVQNSHSFHGISLHVTITVAPENIDKFLEALRPCYEAVIAEPDCTFFEVFQDPEKPGRFRFVENWTKAKDWFMQHQITKDYYKPYMAATEPLWIEPREFTFFSRMPAGWTNAKAENFREGWM